MLRAIGRECLTTAGQAQDKFDRRRIMWGRRYAIFAISYRGAPAIKMASACLVQASYSAGTIL